MADAVAAAAPGGAAAAPGALAAELRALDVRRRQVLAHAAVTIAVLVVTLPLFVLPLVVLPWLQSEPATVAAAEWQRELQAWTTPYLAEIGVVLFVGPILWIFGGVFAWRRLVWLPMHQYFADYKQRVLAAVFREHFPELRYEPDGGIPWQEFDHSGLFPQACDVYRSEDRVSGRYGATDVCFAEAVAQRERRRGFGKDRETVYETLFRGIVFSADFNKHFHSTTRIWPQGADAKRASAERRAELEDPRFAAAFEVWTTDQVDVRYILSPALMERLTALGQRFRGLRARFDGGRVLLLLPVLKNYFEPSLFVAAQSEEQIAGFIGDLRAWLSVVDVLNLNTRIWSKS